MSSFIGRFSSHRSVRSSVGSEEGSERGTFVQFDLSAFADEEEGAGGAATATSAPEPGAAVPSESGPSQVALDLTKFRSASADEEAKPVAKAKAPAVVLDLKKMSVSSPEAAALPGAQAKRESQAMAGTSTANITVTELEGAGSTAAGGARQSIAIDLTKARFSTGHAPAVSSKAPEALKSDAPPVKAAAAEAVPAAKPKPPSPWIPKAKAGGPVIPKPSQRETQTPSIPEDAAPSNSPGRNSPPKQGSHPLDRPAVGATSMADASPVKESTPKNEEASKAVAAGGRGIKSLRPIVRKQNTAGGELEADSKGAAPSAGPRVHFQETSASSSSTGRGLAAQPRQVMMQALLDPEQGLAGGRPSPAGWRSAGVAVGLEEVVGPVKGPYFDRKVCAYYSHSGKWADDVCVALKSSKNIWSCCCPLSALFRLDSMLVRATPLQIRCPCCCCSYPVTVYNSWFMAIAVWVSPLPFLCLAVAAAVYSPPEVLMRHISDKVSALTVQVIEVVICLLLAWIFAGCMWAWILLSLGRKYHIDKALTRCPGFFCEACCCPCIVSVRAGMHIDRTQGFLPAQGSVSTIIELSEKVERWEGQADAQVTSVASSSASVTSAAAAVGEEAGYQAGTFTEEILSGLAEQEAQDRTRRSMMSRLKP